MLFWDPLGFQAKIHASFFSPVLSSCRVDRHPRLAQATEEPIQQPQLLVLPRLLGCQRPRGALRRGALGGSGDGDAQFPGTRLHPVADSAGVDGGGLGGEKFLVCHFLCVSECLCVSVSVVFVAA